MEKEEKIIQEKPKKHYFRNIIFITLLIIIVIVGWAYFIGPHGLKINEIKIVNKDLPSSFDGLKVVHFTDLHFGRTTDLKDLENIVTEISKCKPDVIIFTGDLLDRDIYINEETTVKIIDLLKNLESTYGKYYVVGNHDSKKTNTILDGANFKDLNNTFDVIYNENYDAILINGLGIKADLESLKLYLEVNKDMMPDYQINIMHYPDIFVYLGNYNFDLVLAGHSHNGQIRVPFIGSVVNPSKAKIYNEPYYKVEINKKITDFYISGGLGTSVAPFRLFNKPSFNFYRIVKKDS